VIRRRDFIEPHNPHTARHAAEALNKAANTLLEHPDIGKRMEDREGSGSSPSGSVATPCATACTKKPLSSRTSGMALRTGHDQADREDEAEYGAFPKAVLRRTPKKGCLEATEAVCVP
jgi:hypothetical protein